VGLRLPCGNSLASIRTTPLLAQFIGTELKIPEFKDVKPRYSVNRKKYFDATHEVRAAWYFSTTQGSSHLIVRKTPVGHVLELPCNVGIFAPLEITNRVERPGYEKLQTNLVSRPRRAPGTFHLPIVAKNIQKVNTSAVTVRRSWIPCPRFDTLYSNGPKQKPESSALEVPRNVF